MVNNEFESKRGKTQSIDISPEVISPIKPKKKKHKPKKRKKSPTKKNELECLPKAVAEDKASYHKNYSD